MNEDVLQMPLQYLKGVGPRKAADMKKAGLLTVEDLLFRFPLRYEDRSKLQSIISLMIVTLLAARAVGIL